MPTIVAKNGRKTATRLSVDFPRQNEVIHSPYYTLRLSAPVELKTVEVSIDQGDWQPCRPSVGYWWRDWSGYEDGEHEVVMRVETMDGQRLASEPHEFFVDLQPKPPRT